MARADKERTVKDASTTEAHAASKAPDPSKKLRTLEAPGAFQSPKHARSYPARHALDTIPVPSEGGDLIGRKLDKVATRASKKLAGRSRFAKVAIAIGAALIALLLGAGLGLFAFVGYVNSSIGSFDDEDERQALLDSLAPSEAQREEAEYIAVLGIDSTSDKIESGRADVMMLVRVDKEANLVTLVSIPRDTMVEIEGYGTQKINSAYALGGASGAVECLSAFAGVPINHYVEVHFDKFKDAINMLGGITVNVPESFDAGNGGMAFSAGEQLLSGEQALALVRERFTVSGGDFGRAQAQRLVLMSFIDKVLECSTTEMPSVVGQLALCVTTDYTVPDLALMALTFKSSGITMYSTVCPSYTLNQNGTSYVGTRYEEWQDMMRRVDAGLDPNDADAVIPEPQASNQYLGSAENALSPRDYRSIAEGAGLTTEDVAEIRMTS